MYTFIYIFNTQPKGGYFSVVKTLLFSETNKYCYFKDIGQMEVYET